MDEQILEVMVDFIEENWGAFVQRCEERDLTENDVEKAVDKYKNGEE